MDDSEKIRNKTAELEENYSKHEIIDLIQKELLQRLQELPSETSSQKHRLNKHIRQLEEQLHKIEHEKLKEYTPENYTED